jgi:hypothetical protein
MKYIMLNAQELGVLYMNADHPVTICERWEFTYM